MRFLLLILFLTPLMSFAMSFGSRGAEVVELQRALNEAGYFVTNYGEETDFFGPATEAALRRYQIDNIAGILNGGGMLANLGTLDPLTKKHLMGDGEGTVLGVSTYQFSTNLTPGMTHPDVLRLQQFLNTKGYTVAMSGPGSKGLETMYYGPATQNAVKRYQEAYAASILSPHNLAYGTGLFLASTRAHVNMTGTTEMAGTQGEVPSEVSTTDTRTITIKLNGGGTVSTSNGQSCNTSTCVFSVAHKTKVKLTATPLSGNTFASWSGNCSGTATTCTVTMSRNRSVTANFSEETAPEPGSHTLTAEVSGQGIVLGPGISCPGDCTESFTSGTNVTLTATPTTGSTFAGWSGACSGTSSTCTVSMTMARTVSATFLTSTSPSPTPTLYTLTVTAPTNGTVTGTGISCPGDCTESFTSGTNVTLTTVPASGYTLNNWSGACSGTSSTCTVSMTTARTVSVSFAASGGGTVVGGVAQPTPNAYEHGWKFCTELYSGSCRFEGLRDVRYGNASTGRWVVKEFLNEFPGWYCNPSVFGVTRQSGDHCEVADTHKTGTLAPATMTMSDFPGINLSAIPLGMKGVTNTRIVSSSETLNPQDVGAFRLVCRFSHMAFNDPIVYPGQPGRSHLHTFFGNTGVDAYSTSDSLMTKGGSTCYGGTANRSSYWVPTMIDTVTDTPMIPTDSLWYYKTGYRGVTPESVKVIPKGLRMIAGNPNATSTTSQGLQHHYSCRLPSGEYLSNKNTIYDCPEGGTLTLSIFFPQCWDGVNLDSADHKSHMAYANKGCPASHPVPLPELSLNVGYDIPVGKDTTKWRLSSDRDGVPAGVTLHADFFEGWTPSVISTFTTQCLNKSLDCHASNLGDGTKLETIR